MAKIDLAGDLSGMSGKHYGMVFSKNSYGVYMKKYRKPVNPRTQSQQDVRGKFSELSKEWGKLTDKQRRGWMSIGKETTYVKKGRYFTYMGFTYFMKLNRELQNIGQTLYKDICRSTLVQPPSMYEAIVEVKTRKGKEDIKLKLPEKLDECTSVVVYATCLQKSSRQIDWKQLRVIKVIDSTFKQGGSIKDAYVEKYGYLPGKEDKVGFAVMAVNNYCGLTGGKMYITPES